MNDTGLAQYLPIVLLLVLALVFAAASILVSRALGPRRSMRTKEAPYESGIIPERTLSERFPVKFYLVAMLFIVFDIETVFLYPWAVAYSELRLFGLVEMATFIAILLAAYVYVWKRGGLEWAE